MKKPAIILAAAMMMAALFPAALHDKPIEADAADPVRIMPVGDSITFGMGEDGGYRKYLSANLSKDGIDFDLVGPEGSDQASFNYQGQFTNYDNNHAGYSGYTIKQQYPIPSWGENGLLEVLQKKDAVKTCRPDIILLIIGTNDMTANRNLNDCAQDLHTLVDYMLENMPEGGTVFMGTIPEFSAYGGSPERVGGYNNTVKKVAEEYISQGKNVRFADVHGCLNGTQDLGFDQLHPNGTGYEKMGKFWTSVVEDFLKESVITTTTTTSTTTSTTTTQTTTSTTTTQTTTSTTTTQTTTSTTTTQTTVQEIQLLPGDVNCSGVVDIKDAVMMARLVGGDTTVIVSDAGMVNANCDGEDNVNASDLTMLLRYLARLIDALKVPR